MATANGVSDKKSAVLLAAIEKAMSNPEYVQKEQKNRNHLMFRKGKEMWSLLRAGQKVAEDAAYWKQGKQ